MVEVISLLVVLVMSLIITRVATVALALTGMSHPVAQFQARSALTGAGFTTSESERVTSHPVRRRIIMSLMLIGNTGLVLGASLVILLLSRGESDLSDRLPAFGLLLGGLVALYLVARSVWVERAMRRVIEGVLSRHTDLDRRDHASLLRLQGDYRVAELAVDEHDWLSSRQLADLELSREGVLVLGISRPDGTYVGAPRAEDVIEPGDSVVLYGRQDQIEALDRRRAGVGGHLQHAEFVAREAIRKSEATEEQEDEGA